MPPRFRALRSLTCRACHQPFVTSATNARYCAPACGKRAARVRDGLPDGKAPWAPSAATLASRRITPRPPVVRRAILGLDFLGIEAEARALLERACNPPDATRRTRGGKRCAPDLRASGRP